MRPPGPPGSQAPPPPGPPLPVPPQVKGQVVLNRTHGIQATAIIQTRKHNGSCDVQRAVTTSVHCPQEFNCDVQSRCRSRGSSPGPQAAPSKTRRESVLEAPRNKTKADRSSSKLVPSRIASPPSRNRWGSILSWSCRSAKTGGCAAKCLPEDVIDCC